MDESDANGGTVVFDSADGGFKVPETTLYSVTTSYYIALFLASFNLKPLDQNGQEVVLLDRIVSDGDHEMKLWYALAKFIAASATSNSGNVPNLYNDDSVGPYWRRCWDIATHPK